MNFFNPCGRRIWVASAVLLCWLWTTSALGDGKVFPAIAFPADVKIPDQSALLIWSNSVERLVIQTRFVGEGTNFAWVVPLPAVPTIEPATTGLFSTLRYSLQADLRHRVTRWWGVSLFAAGLLWLLLTVRRDRPRSGIDFVACLSAAGGFAAIVPGKPAAVIGGPVLFLALLLVANRVRGRRERAYAFLLAVLLVLLMSAMLLPALAKGGSAAAAAKDGVEVLDQTMAGIYDSTTVSAKDPGALLDWLNQNGFAAPTNARPIVESLVRDGWVFVAAKVRRETNSSSPATPHPLSFTFKTAKPVYPLRLTGVGNSNLVVELFAAGTGRASIKGFKVTECRQIERADGINWSIRGIGKLGHPQMLDWLQGASVLTRLEAPLDAASMQEDAEVVWQDFRPTRARFYSKSGAAQTAANWTVPLASVVALVVGVLWHRRRMNSKRAASVTLAMVLAAGTAAIAVHAALPKVAVRMQRGPWIRARDNLELLALDCKDSFLQDQLVSLDSVREDLARRLSQQDPRRSENLLLGGPIREEDSPGNYTLRETPEGVEIIGHDPTGAGRPIGLVAKPAPR